MRNVFQTYEIQLETVGPLYIGFGQEIGKKEYAFLQGKKQVAVLEPQKLYGLLKEKKLLGAYEKFIMGTSRLDVGSWLEMNHVSPKEYLACQRYILDAGDAVTDKKSKLEIREFVKDAYGKPYIPGSSLKGMLRTVLLAQNIIEESGRYHDVKDNITETLKRNIRPNRNICNREARDMEIEFFNILERLAKRKEDAVNDFMSGMVVGDSEPLEMDDFILCQRIELHSDGKERRLNVLRESLRPETKVKFVLTIDNRKCNLGKTQIEQAISEFGNMYYQCFLKKFGFPRQKENSVWLGGGVGFVSKTEIYPLFGERHGVDVTAKIFQGTKVPEKHKHFKDKQLGVSPHVCKVTYYHGKKYQIGQCSLRVQERQ